MIPYEQLFKEGDKCFPRIRGGDPKFGISGVRTHKVFPVYAGVIPYLPSPLIWVVGFPRIRGGDPKALHPLYVDKRFSPYTRG